jgi:hypothetical protein
MTWKEVLGSLGGTSRNIPGRTEENNERFKSVSKLNVGRSK